MSSLEFHNGLTGSRVMYNSQFNLNIYPDWDSKGICRNTAFDVQLMSINLNILVQILKSCILSVKDVLISPHKLLKFDLSQLFEKGTCRFERFRAVLVSLQYKKNFKIFFISFYFFIIFSFTSIYFRCWHN